MISEAHRQQLQFKYGLPESKVMSLDEGKEISSLSPSEVRSHLGKEDIDSSGFLIRYPGNGASTIRLDSPPIDERGRPRKYLRRAGEPNSLYIPSGLNLPQAGEIWITEGELKALCGHAYGLPVVALSGVYNWRTSGEEAPLLAEGEKLSDEEALLSELAQINWEGKKINLLYDSDITKHPEAGDAFPRLAEMLYSRGAGEVRILSLPPGEKGQKVGLDDFILARGPAQALQDLQKIRDRAEPYLPIRAGALAYAERVIKSEDLEDRLKATVAYLGAKGKVFALEWLKEKGIRGETRTALLSDAKERLAQLQAQARPRASSQEEKLELGPEYDTPKALLKDVKEFIIDDLGRLSKIVYIERNGTVEIKALPICNFVAWPLRDILKDDGLSKERFIEFQGLLQGGASLKPFTISSKIFLEMKWPIDAWGARAAIKPKQEQEVRYALQLMAQEGIPESTIYTYLGWRKENNSWIYLHAGGAVGSEAVEVEISDKLRKYILPKDKGDIKEALKASLSLLKLGPKKIMVPLYALVWLTPLLEPLRQAGIEPGFITYLWGTSGSFKSTIIALLVCHFGDFDPKGLPASFRDTGKSIEEMAFLAKDTLLPVDDLYPAKNPKERMSLEGTLEYLSRNQGDRQGRGRLKSNTELRLGHPPRGLALCSGEEMHLSGSTLARNFVLHLLKEDINQERLTQAQAQKSLLSQAMMGYLEYLAPQIEALPPHFQEDFERLRKEARGASKTRTRHRRLDETVSHLFLGLNLFLQYAITQEALSEKEAGKLLEEAWATLNEVADDLAQIAETEEPTRRFFEALQELQTLGRVYFASMEDAPPETVTLAQGAVRIGWGPDNGVYYLLWGPAWGEVTKYLHTQGEGLSLSKSSFLDYMEQKGLLDRSQSGRRIIKKKIAGEQPRVLPVLAKAFNLEEGENEA